jgi:hypothetical protein
MPKRSNQFQKLIKYVASQVAPVGATVHESTELLETGVDQPITREVDVLIELDAGVSRVRAALECRDSNRKADVQWIDRLIGTYRNLPVNQIIAVSKSGFTKAALSKARRNNIVPLSLSEAEGEDWRARFAKLGALEVSQRYTVASITLEIAADAAMQPALDDDVALGDASGQIRKLKVNDLLQYLVKAAVPLTHEYLSANMLSVFKTVADLDKTAVVEHRLPLNRVTLAHDGHSYSIEAATVVIHVRNERAEIAVTRQLLGDHALLTSAVLAGGPDRDIPFSITAVQARDKSEGAVFIEAGRKSTRRSRKE